VNVGKEKKSTFIVNLESGGTDAALVEALEQNGLWVDRDYGFVKLDPEGRHRVACVRGTERQVQQAESALLASS
jgi:hypothetical protein